MNSQSRCLRAALVAGLLLAVASVGSAQPRPPPQPPRSARQAAPIDLTGQWVSIVTEDWRFRMVTPPKGDYAGFQLTPAGAAIAQGWDPARDEAEGNQCKSYGAAAIMRVPGRLRISWEDDSTLKIETDSGRQTRLLHFDALPDSAAGTWQGASRAEWLPHGGGFGRPVTNGSLKVVTTKMKEGYLRKNGVPYSANAVLTEYFDVLGEPDGSQWLVVKTIVEDPTYHTDTPITSSNFRKQSDRSGWDPQPCTAR
ncbi:MAG TPA: hypothetical protein VL131_09950 [Gammaproteobacteria bacterium]|nr:hypothetical protein [Gammaproteobacteria bacterium]